ncbi:MAG TPA: hypothetical protein VNP20_18600 [Nocardioidaceae bacterium]|nr:hypothetical protein [Nocardioidaceae bacterium]
MLADPMVLQQPRTAHAEMDQERTDGSGEREHRAAFGCEVRQAVPECGGDYDDREETPAGPRTNGEQLTPRLLPRRERHIACAVHGRSPVSSASIAQC